MTLYSFFSISALFNDFSIAKHWYRSWQMIELLWSTDVVIMTDGAWCTVRGIRSDVTLSTTNPTWAGLKLNPDLGVRGRRLSAWSMAFPACSRVETESDGTRRRTGGEVKWKEANGVDSQQSCTASERSLSSITTADTHTSAASSRLNWCPPADLTLWPWSLTFTV